MLKDAHGKRVPYAGRIARRRPHTSAKYVSIAPRASVSVTIDMSEAFGFVAGQQYTAMLHPGLRVHVRRNPFEPSIGEVAQLKVTPETLPIVATATSELPLERSQRLRLEKRLTTQSHKMNLASFGMTNCTADETTAINAAIASVTPAIDDVVNNYFAQNCSDSVYSLYFGTITSERYNQVKSHFQNIQALLQGTLGGGSDGNLYSFYCEPPECDTDTYAFVFPNDTTYTVHLCQQAFSGSAPLAKYDSTAGTFVHEFSHFDRIAGTSDFAYGNDNARQIALADPDHAILNADNHEYFMEEGPVAAGCTPVTIAPADPNAPTTDTPTQAPTSDGVRPTVATALLGLGLVAMVTAQFAL
jgi:peptidyl-Lys metalloendopeptidase